MPYWHGETCGGCGVTYRTTYQGNHPLCTSCRYDNSEHSSGLSSRSRSPTSDVSCNSGESEPGWQEIKLYHGTSWESACQIEASGFERSTEGRLGPGIYFARFEKAHRFALCLERHGGDAGGMVEALVSFRYPKYVTYEDDTWFEEGYDACRADMTAKSTNMEWCVADPGQVEVLRIWQVDPEDYDYDKDDAEEGEIQEHVE
jgi:hypothetical protein